MSKNNQWNIPLHGSAAFTPEQVQFRQEWGLEPKHQVPPPGDAFGAPAPLTVGRISFGSDGNAGRAASRGEPMSPREMAQLTLSVLLLPACVYVVAGSLTVLPWWAYVVASFVALGLFARSELFCESMLRFGTATAALLAMASLFQVIPLASRAVLGGILLASLIFSLFTLVTGKAERLNQLSGTFFAYWLGTISILIIFIVACQVMALWHVDAGGAQSYAIQILKFMTSSLYDAALELWALASASWR